MFWQTKWLVDSGGAYVVSFPVVEIQVSVSFFQRFGQAVAQFPQDTVHFARAFIDKGGCVQVKCDGEFHLLFAKGLSPDAP